MGILLHIPSDRDRTRALDIFDRVTEKAGEGTHNLTLGVTGTGGTAVASFPFVQTDEGMAASLSQLNEFCELLAVAVSGAHPSGLVMRTLAQAETVCGWRFTDGDPLPLHRAEAFNAYCHHPVTGEITLPCPGTEYVDAPVIHM
ncbi:hypothetical protein OOK43_31615 [[Kitasatospora] papulosa]|uniref:hypothetical protein n=1 Tax=Streptomyces TaxID=1883 RepID=UPI00224CA802|nr:hypothetical protein [[Kitasatospora] papulosa]MCX4417789.1 hypothetical protein [[Kitasatospora] papulosa]